MSASHHIDELGLRIATDPGALDEGELRRAAEDLTRAVLLRVADRIEERAPGRVIRMRALPIRWRLDASAMTGPPDARPDIDELAMPLVRALEARLPAPDDRPREDADLVVFADEAHHLAASLASRARGEHAWYSAEPARGAPPVEALAQIAARGGAELARAALGDLARMGHIESVLTAGEPAAIAGLAIALGVAVDVRGEAVSPPLASPPPASPSFQPAPGSIDTAATVRALLRHAWLQPRAIAAPFSSVAPAAVPDPLHLTTTPSRASASPRYAPDVGAAVGPHATPSWPESKDTAPLAQPRDASRSTRAPSLADAATAGDPSATTLRPSETTTAYAGLFYLLNPIIELELPEILWRACLPEGQVLGHALAALLGEELDPAPAIMAGTFLEPSALDDASDAPRLRTETAPVASVGAPPGRASEDSRTPRTERTVQAVLRVSLECFPEISADQHAEIAVAVLAALARALPRRGLAAIPTIEIALTGAGAGRLLVACAAGTELVLFAWPAATGGDAACGLAAFLAAWPANASVVGHGAVASLDPRGRVRPLAAPGPAPFVPDLPSAPAAALLAQIVGAPCQLMAARIDAEPLSPAALRARLSARGSIVDDGDRLEVHIPASAVDLAIRGAGLDRDPGCCAWLQRDVRIYFTG